MGANRTTILSIRGLSWSAIPRAVRLCKADLETGAVPSKTAVTGATTPTSIENERGFSFAPLTDYNTPCCLNTALFFWLLAPEMNDIETLINDSDVEKEIFLRHGRLVYRFSTEEWIYEIEELNFFYKELYYSR